MKKLPLSILAAVMVAGISSIRADSGSSPKKPRLGVLIVVDQMRGDYPVRFGPYFTGGLHRLLSEGAVLDSASHEHANTETAVGHATLSTGCFPKHHGIVGNDFYDRAHDRVVYSVDDTLTRIVRTTVADLKRVDSLGASAQYLMKPSIGNLLNCGRSGRVFSVSLKDRAAILMAGQVIDSTNRPTSVYWWDFETGDFVTSTAYTDKLPSWVDDFNRGPNKSIWQDSVWNRLLDNSKLHTYESIGPDSVVLENDGVHLTFPHYFNVERKGSGHYDAVYRTPLADQLLIQFAREMVRREKIGAGETTDLLLLSCSAADAVGHAYGPHSQEILDYYLRLDRYLDTLLCELDTLVGRGNYVVALSSDHGVLDLPPAEHRISKNDYKSAIFGAFSDTVPLTKHDSMVLLMGSDIILLRTAREANAPNLQLTDSILKILDALPYIDRSVYLRFNGPDFRGLFPNMRLEATNCYPSRMPHFMVIFKDSLYLTNSETGTSHGSPWWYDRHVPIVFWGPGIKAQHYRDRVRTVDVAPTMADLLGIEIPDSLDGHSLVDEIIH